MEHPAPPFERGRDERRDRMVGRGAVGHEQGLGDPAGLEAALDHVGALGHKGAFAPPGGAVLQQPAQAADPLVRVGQRLGQEAASSAGVALALAATATRAPKASASRTARSARILRSTSTPAWCSPLMKRL